MSWACVSRSTIIQAEAYQGAIDLTRERNVVAWAA